jgi:hypothetical protein
MQKNIKTCQSINEGFDKEFVHGYEVINKDFSPVTPKQIKQFFHSQYQQLVEESVGHDDVGDDENYYLKGRTGGYNSAKAEIRKALKFRGLLK